MNLSADHINDIKQIQGLEIPDEKQMLLQERVLQFGTGVLLRGLVDYFIDKANKKGVFNGRVVVVKSTDSDSSAFDRQDGLYTICIRGKENEQIKEEYIISSAISRVISAQTEWEKVLQCAHNPDIKIIVSNTTELGIQLVQDDVSASPPYSFPGKLLAFLLERYKAFKGNKESGLVIIPTELIDGNGEKLESIVFELAHLNKLEYEFIEWLESSNTFCNSLVDRIVPGKPAKEELQKIYEKLGYEDELITVCEVFRLWAIEGGRKVEEVLSFSKTDSGVKIVPDITLFKELKIRLLNGVHTFSCGLAFLSGFDLTRDSVLDKDFHQFLQRLIFDEIIHAIPCEIDEVIKKEFASSVIERFANPFIDHPWLSISVNYSAKMLMRNVPLLLEHYKLKTNPPEAMALSFAGYILFMRPLDCRNKKFYGKRGNVEYEISEKEASFFHACWKLEDPGKVVNAILSNEELWNTDLTSLPGFQLSVQSALKDLLEYGVLETIRNCTKKIMS